MRGNLRVCPRFWPTLLGQTASEKGLAFTIEIPDALTRQTLRGDPLRLGQILINLAGNAIKFTVAGSVAVHVLTSEETTHDLLLRIEVRDSGIGISANDQKPLFTAFEQADGSTTRKYGTVDWGWRSAGDWRE